MKTLVFYGSARKNGHTKEMLDLFLKNSQGEVEIIDCYREKNISPCKDCRYCWTHAACAVNDHMQEIYKKVDEADRIILASPMYFYCVPGPMKNVLDRLQLYWAARVRKDQDKIRPKKGVILMNGGAPSHEKQFQAGKIVLECILNDLNAPCAGVITLPNTDHDSLETRTDVAEELIRVAENFW